MINQSTFLNRFSRKSHLFAFLFCRDLQGLHPELDCVSVLL